jgi:hypothetical protein
MEPVPIFTRQQKRIIVALAMIAFAMLYLGMRLAGLSNLAVWW